MLAVVQDNVDVLLIVEVAMQFDDIWMVESPLNFELSFHLAKEVKLLEHVLEDHLQRTRHTRASFRSLEYFAKLATADSLNPSEVIDSP